MEISKTKFLIVGAGPAGLAMAYLLAKRGHAVQLIGKDQAFRRQLCGEYLSPAGTTLLKMFPGVSQGFEPIEGMRVCASGYDLSATFPEGAAGISVRRGELEARLFQLAIRAGAQISLGEAFVDTEFNNGRHNILTSRRKIQSEFLIAADGRKSMVAKKLGLMKKPDTRRTAVGVIAKTSDSRRMGEMHLLSNSCYLGIDPNSMAEANLSVVVPSKILKTIRPAILLRDLLKEAGVATRFDFEDSAVQTTTPITHQPRQVFFMQGCLIGDAAAFADPITGEGMTMALKSAFLLMDILDRGQPLNQIPSIYGKEHKKLVRPKFLLKPAFDMLIHDSPLRRIAGEVLTHRPVILQNLLGMIGQIYTPWQFLKYSILNVP